VHEVRDPDALAVIAALKRRRSGGPQLLAYRAGRRWTAVHSEDINDYIKRNLGEGFSAKDFRTWNATVMAAVTLASDGREANAGYNSDTYKKELQQTARTSAKVVRNQGDVDGVFAKGAKIIEAEYYVPHLAHAAMEPLVAVADYRNGIVTAWAPTQNPQAVQDTVAKALGIAKENVVCHVTLLGGGFGRKSKPDYVAEAAILSKKVGRPVKVVWTREDDIQFDYYHSVAAMYLKAAVDANGKPTAWLQRSAFPPIGSMGDPKLTYGGDF
jgi:isoquinoline 1-oxidoreductase beta subunit